MKPSWLRHKREKRETLAVVAIAWIGSHEDSVSAARIPQKQVRRFVRSIRRNFHGDVRSSRTRSQRLAGHLDYASIVLQMISNWPCLTLTTAESAKRTTTPSNNDELNVEWLEMSVPSVEGNMTIDTQTAGLSAFAKLVERSIAKQLGITIIDKS